MIGEVKAELLKNPDKIINILSYFGFCKFDYRNNELRFARDDNGGAGNVRIKLYNNDALYVADFAKGLSLDFFKYIIAEKGKTFSEIMGIVRQELNIKDFYFEKKESLFGGFYTSIKRRIKLDELNLYGEEILLNYNKGFSKAFLKDHISFEAQCFFDIAYDVHSQRIVFPIRTLDGQIMGVKGRANWQISEEEPKYLYLVQCPSSRTLFGYSHNYASLKDAQVIVVESEKAVMQAYSYGYRNVIALGSSSMSTHQAKAIAELSPQSVIFMMDEGLDYDIISNIIETMLNYSALLEIKVGMWDSKCSKIVKKDTKKNPFDIDKQAVDMALESEILWIIQ